LLLLLILLGALRRFGVVASAWGSGAPVGTRTPNQLIKSQLLYQLSYRGTGTFYGRVTVDGKIYRESLETTVYSVAKQKLPDYLKEKLRKKRQIGAPATFVEARKLFEQDLENDHALSDSMKRYRRYCIKKLLASWPELDKRKLNQIIEPDCKEWAGRL